MLMGEHLGGRDWELRAPGLGTGGYKAGCKAGHVMAGNSLRRG